MAAFLSVLKWSAVVGAVTLAVAALKPVLDRRYSPRWRYVLWLVLALALVLSPVLRSGLLPAPAAPLVTVEVPRVEVAVGGGNGLTFRQPEIQRPADPAVSTPAVPAAGSQTHTPAQSGTSAAPQGPVSQKPERTLPLGTLAAAVWLMGAAAFALWHLAGTLWFARRARRWSRPADQNTVTVYNEVRREMGLNGSPRLRISALADSPMVLGLFRPCLLLPDRWYSDRELAFILRHELTHYRRRDLWYKLVVLAANALHWFNPLAYLLRREAEATLELLCDEAAVAGEDRETRQAYCEVLLASVHRQKGLQRAVLSTHFYGGASVMKERFRNLLGGPGRRFGWAMLALALSVTALCACTLAVAQAGDKDGEDAESTPLTQEELDLWQERLESGEWNGFVTNMYSDVRRLSLRELLYNGAGISRELTDGEMAAFVEENQGGPETDIFAMDVADIEAYLEEHTGYMPEDFASGLAEFDTLGGFPDMVYLYHGDTNYNSMFKVTGGTKDGGTVQLEVDNSGWDGSGTGTLTVQDGKVVSFTNDLYTAVEELAWERVDRIAAAVDAQGAGQVVYRTVTLHNFGEEPLESGDRTYLLYFMDYRLCLDQPWDGTIDIDVDGQTITLTGGSCIHEDENSVLVVSVDGDGNAVPERFLTGAEKVQWWGKWDDLLREVAGMGPIFTEEKFAAEPYTCAQELLLRLTDGQYFTVRLYDGRTGQGEDMSFTPENGGTVCDAGHLIHQTYAWETATEAEWNEASGGRSLNITNGDAQFLCRQGSDLLAMTEDGETWWYCRAKAMGDGQPDLYEMFLEAARGAVAEASLLDYVNQVYAAITDTTDFILRVTEGDQVWEYGGGAVWNVATTMTEGQVTEVTAADWSAASRPGTVFEITDGVRHIRCRTADELAAVTDGDNTRYFRITNTDDVFDGGSVRLRRMADEAVEDDVFYGGSVDGDLDMDAACRTLAGDIARRMNGLPDWVAWRPADFQVERAEVYDAYLGQPEQFCANISFYLQLTDDISSMARGWWETGSGLSGPIASGRYAGYYTWGRECLVTKNDARDWVLSDMGTGGCSVDLPGWTLSAGMGNYLGNASAAELADLFFLTEGQTHDYLLPMHICEKPEAEQESVLAGLPQAKARELRNALAAYRAEYGG